MVLELASVATVALIPSSWEPGTLEVALQPVQRCQRFDERLDVYRTKLVVEVVQRSRFHLAEGATAGEWTAAARPRVRVDPQRRADADDGLASLLALGLTIQLGAESLPLTTASSSARACSMASNG